MLEFLAQDTAPASAPNPWLSMAPFLLLIVGMYFLMIAPQNKRRKEHKKMLEALAQGDRVMTNGGIYGTVMRVDAADDKVTLRISENAQIEVNRQFVANKVAGDAAVAPAK